MLWHLSFFPLYLQVYTLRSLHWLIYYICYQSKKQNIYIINADYIYRGVLKSNPKLTRKHKRFLIYAMYRAANQSIEIK